MRSATPIADCVSAVMLNHCIAPQLGLLHLFVDGQLNALVWHADLDVILRVANLIRAVSTRTTSVIVRATTRAPGAPCVTLRRSRPGIDGVYRLYGGRLFAALSGSRRIAIARHRGCHRQPRAPRRE